MFIPFVDLKTQYRNIKNEIDQAVMEVLSNCDFVGGAAVQAFEEEFSAYCNAENCVGVGNGTDALWIALKTLGIGAGDEVITAANSFIATSESITLAGARVIFADINPKTFTIDPDAVEAKITARTKAIIPVHLHGQTADMDPVIEIAARHGIKVIEDAAQAHGGLYKGRKVGTLGDVACFSFYPGKNLGAYGDAGAIVTGNDELARKARKIANHGRVDKYNHDCEGTNSRLDTVQAAILRVKLKHLEGWTAQRQQNAELYSQQLQGVVGVTVPAKLDHAPSVFHLYVIRVDKDVRSSLQEHLTGKGVATGIHYPIALPNLDAYEYLDHAEADFPHATAASKEILSLPMYPELTGKQIRYVTDAIQDFFASTVGVSPYRSERVRSSDLVAKKNA